MNIFKQKLNICYVCVILMYSCNERLPSDYKTINLDSFFKNHKIMNLSEITSKVEYIKLETSPECLIGRIKKLIAFNDKYYILDGQTESILIFDSNGKYISKIHKTGKGPGEYVQIADFVILPIDSSILLIDNMQVKLVKYDLASNLVRESRLHAITHKIAVLNDSLIALQFNYPDFTLNDNYNISILDKDMNKLTSLIKMKSNILPEEVGHTPGHNLVFFSTVNDTLTYWEYRYDIVYKIINYTEAIGQYYLHYNQKLQPGDMKGYFDIPKDKNELIVFMESTSYMFMRGTTMGKTFRLIYLKDRDIAFNIMNGESDEIYNDMDSGPAFFPEGLLTDGRAYKTFSLYEFKMKTGNTSLPDKLKDETYMEENPYVMFVNLK